MQNVPKALKSMTVLSFSLSLLASLLFVRFRLEPCLTLAITFGTLFYHLAIRLCVGLLFQARMQNRADYRKKWYQLRPWEAKLYALLHVKAWKGKMPTYNAAAFSPKEHSWDEIAQAMCQAELVHEANMLLSFLPVLASRWFGAFYVFLATSLCGAAFDLAFVIMQRYNRARILKIAGKRP